MAEARKKRWVDFQELKERVTFEQVLERLELLPGLERAGDELRGQCPICKRGDAKSKCFSINVSKQVFQCFACKKRGNVLDFTAAARDTDVHRAALWLRDQFLTNPETPKPRQTESPDQGAGVTAAAAAGGEASLPASPEVIADQRPPAAEGFTAREAWLVQVMARGVAWYLMDTCTPFHDVETMTHGIMARVEMAAGLSEPAAGNGDNKASPT